MRQIVFVVLALMAFIACEKDPDLEKVQDDYMVYTQYNKGVAFSDFKTFYAPDSILRIGNEQNQTYLTNTSAQTMIQAYVTNLENRGFKRVAQKDSADFGVQLSYIENTQYVMDWWGGDYPWIAYPYYWSPSYWGPSYGDWFYPYPITYSFSTGTLMGELLELTPAGKQGTAGSTNITVMWSSLISGFIYGSGNMNVNKVVASIDQAFVQSPYLKTTQAK